MMLLYIYIGTVIFSLLSLFGALFAIKKELMLTYTKDQLKQFFNKYTTNFLTKYFVVLCPIINVIFGLIYMFEYKTIKEQLIQEIRDSINR